MSKITHGFYRPSAARFGENVRGAKVFGHVEPRKACTDAGLERNPSKDLVSK